MIGITFDDRPELTPGPVVLACVHVRESQLKPPLDRRRGQRQPTCQMLDAPTGPSIHAQEVAEGEVLVLDGGLGAWVALGLPLERDAVEPTPGSYEFTQDPELVADWRQVSIAPLPRSSLPRRCCWHC